MGNKLEVILPSHHSEQQLSNTVGEFFMEKIELIRNNLLMYIWWHGKLWYTDIKFEGVQLINFSPASIDEIRKSIQ